MYGDFVNQSPYPVLLDALVVKMHAKDLPPVPFSSGSQHGHEIMSDHDHRIGIDRAQKAACCQEASPTGKSSVSGRTHANFRLFQERGQRTDRIQGDAFDLHPK